MEDEGEATNDDDEEDKSEDNGLDHAVAPEVPILPPTQVLEKDTTFNDRGAPLSRVKTSGALAARVPSSNQVVLWPTVHPIPAGQPSPDWEQDANPMMNLVFDLSYA